MALAQRELQVVLVDGDLRLPRLHELFALGLGAGLTGSLLDGAADIHLKQGVVERLKVLTSGSLPPNPTEVVASKRMSALLKRLSQGAVLVLVDSPPVLPVADASVLASRVDGVMLVVQANRTHRRDLQTAVENLRKVGANLLGVVLNGVWSRDARYYQYYGDARRNGRNGKCAGEKPTRSLANLWR